MPIKNQTLSELSTHILTAEYEYIANSAAQANEDRARVTSFYLVAVGSLIAALSSTQILNADSALGSLSLLFSGLFLVLTLLGSLTVVQLARLRAAWYESMSALNQIKEFAISRDKDIAEAFRWRSRTMPPAYKVNSVSFQQTIEVAILCGLTFGAAIYFLQQGIHYNCTPCNWAYTLASAVFAFLAQLFVYKWFLSRSQPQEQ